MTIRSRGANTKSGKTKRILRRIEYRTGSTCAGAEILQFDELVGFRSNMRPPARPTPPRSARRMEHDLGYGQRKRTVYRASPRALQSARQRTGAHHRLRGWRARPRGRGRTTMPRAAPRRREPRVRAVQGVVKRSCVR